MSTIKKVILRVIPIALILMVTLGVNVYSDDPETIFDYSDTPGRTGDSVTKIDDSVQKVWSSVVLILQVASVAAFVFAGVRYMFASADSKADIKKSMIFLVIGAIFVFAATTVVDFIVTSFKDIVS